VSDLGQGDARGPLRGVRVIELAGIGPAPYAAMLLSDLGAEVIRVERTDTAARAGPAVPGDIVTRGGARWR
jgi:alpha-methylacyl-CoA racemase